MKALFFVAALILGANVFATEAKYSVEARGAPLADLIRMIAQIEGHNVVLPTKMEGLVTASLPDIRLDDALNAILETHELSAVRGTNVLQIVAKKDAQELGQDLTTETFFLKYAKARVLERQAATLISKRGTVTADERTNSLTIRDGISHLENARTLIAALDKIDKQVLIEARVVEATKNFSRNFGIQWGVTNTSGPVQVGGIKSLGLAESGRALMASTAAANPALGLAMAMGPFGDTLLDLQLTAAEQNGDLSILSRPSIVTSNNQAARIHSGTQFFIKTAGNFTIAGAAAASPSSLNSTNLQQITAGITMVVTPQITADDRVNMMIDVIDSQPDFSRAIDGVPAINDNAANTIVLLQDGETTVIGGLAQHLKSNNKKGIPFLSNIPILGYLFGSNERTDKDTELLIFLTPRIVKAPVKKLDGYSEESQKAFEIGR